MIKILTYSHKRPDFIKLQYESIKKHLKSEYEYIVFNNSIDSIDNYNEIHRICKELNIKCVDVELDEELRITHNELNYTSNRYTNPNLACSYPLIWTFKKFLSKDDDIICIIDSDMFFINDIDIYDKIKDKDLIYIPQYRTINVKYAWNAFICLNIKKCPELLNFDWHPGQVNGMACDVGGQTHHNLLNGNYDCEIIEEYSVRDIIKNKEDFLVNYIQNGNVNYDLIIGQNNELISCKHTNGYKMFENKSFPHENDKINYYEYLHNRVISILSFLVTKNVNLPDPKHIGFIGFMNSDDFFILHYKSGSNYLDFTTDKYNLMKTQELIKILK